MEVGSSSLRRKPQRAYEVSSTHIGSFLALHRLSVCSEELFFDETFSFERLVVVFIDRLLSVVEPVSGSDEGVLANQAITVGDLKQLVSLLLRRYRRL